MKTLTLNIDDEDYADLEETAQLLGTTVEEQLLRHVPRVKDFIPRDKLQEYAEAMHRDMAPISAEDCDKVMREARKERDDRPSMSLVIRNIPGTEFDKFCEIAEADHVTVEDEALAAFRQFLQARENADAFIADARRFRESVPFAYASAAEIDADINEGNE